MENHFGWPDDEVLELALQMEAFLITEDKDFGELTYRLKKPSNGILLVRMPAVLSEAKASLVLNIFREHPERLWMKFAVLEPNKLRVKSLRH